MTPNYTQCAAHWTGVPAVRCQRPAGHDGPHEQEPVPGWSDGEPGDMDHRAERVRTALADGDWPAGMEAAVADWHDDKWDDKADPRVMGAKLAEEAGEVCGALIKRAEGRRTDLDLADELGDVLVCLTVIAGREGWTLHTLLADRLEAVLDR